MKLLLLAFLVIVTPQFAGDFVSGSNTCPTSGAKQVSATSYNVMNLVVTAGLSNAGQIHLGGSNVTTSDGGVLTPGASFFASKPSNSVNPATLYFACTTNTDTISWIGAR